ncbi:UDP-glucose 4-epimerase GalE [Alphaproteobacteria bacterium]|nr:UDP-glucose 4-epimerase GalE [Alphaproteobacteria bacterium]
MNKNIIVTGGAGYIGSHACKALREVGFTPITFDNLSTGWKEAVKFGPFEYGNLLNQSDIDRVFKKYSPFAVMHFASLSEVGESISKPDLYWKNNVIGSFNLIQSAISYNCKHFVFSSTCATYGDQDGVVLKETSSQFPVNSYGSSKRAVENMLADFEVANGMKHVIFRYFNVAGADPEAEIGEYHDPETHLIPLIFHTIDGKREKLTIFGTDYDTHDGTCIRDYVHVCDLVDAHILGLQWLQEGKNSRVFNLGTGNGFSVREVIEQAKKITNQEFLVIEGKRRPGDCTKLVSGSSLAEAELGWSLNRSNLTMMITDAWRWHKNGSYSE